MFKKLEMLNSIFYSLQTWLEEGSEVAPFKSGSPNNSGLQGSSFQPLNITYNPLKQSQWWDGWEVHLNLINQTNRKQNASNREDFKQ